MSKETARFICHLVIGVGLIVWGVTACALDSVDPAWTIANVVSVIAMFGALLVEKNI